MNRPADLFFVVNGKGAMLAAAETRALADEMKADADRYYASRKMQKALPVAERTVSVLTLDEARTAGILDPWGLLVTEQATCNPAYRN